MTQIILRTTAKNQSHFILITEKFRNDFGLPEKVTDYFESEFSTFDKEKKKGNHTLNYNYIGRQISIIRISGKQDPYKQREELRKLGATFADTVNRNKGTEVQIINQTRDQNLSLFAAEGLVLGNYQFNRHRTASKDSNSLRSVTVISARIRSQTIDELNATCEATLLARDLVNEPVNILNATALSKEFQKMGKTAGFSVEVWNKKKIEQMKMGGLLAVNAGSVDEPTFSIMTYKHPQAKNKKPYVIVGKGVVYDTGGLSLKPTSNSMDMMKCDMAGAAAVACALYAIAKSKLKLHVVALVPATDNRPGFNAFAPGDIITMMDDSTVEMLNSDAEGRMILADALHFAKKYEPALVIDLATLTGSAVAALGTSVIAGMGTAADPQKNKLLESGRRVHERVAELPFYDDYDEVLKSDVADQKNIGGPYAGAITAGRFLLKYTAYPYYHLDIAGPAFLTSKESYRGKGGTGTGVRLLFDYFKSLS
jgi:leucyl aminopeptidase